MTEHFPDPNAPGHMNGLPSRRRRRAETVRGDEAQWWNAPPQTAGDAGSADAAAPAAGDAGWGTGTEAVPAAGEWDGAGWEPQAGVSGMDGSPARAAEPVPDAVSMQPLPPMPAGSPDSGHGESGSPEPLSGQYPNGQYTGGEAAAILDAYRPAVAGPPAPHRAPEVQQPGSRAEARTERSRHGGHRASFLDQKPAAIPASRGFRGLLAQLGLRVQPSGEERAERQDMRAVSQHWPGPSTVSVVNGKGGANKTPTTVMLAAVFARNGGGPVLAWDNNETRGTLGWRTEQGPHEATVMDLLPNTADLLSPSAQSALLARFVHHQVEDKFDVLRSKPDVLASEQKITADDFDALHEVASKYFRLNIIDSGNDESAERWLRMIDHTTQLVIATTTVEEHAEAGALLLEALQARGGRYAELAENAVVIVSQSDRNGTDQHARKVAEGFGQLARAAVTIPYDPALRKGQIRYESLKPAARRAWLAAAAAVAEGL